MKSSKIGWHIWAFHLSGVPFPRGMQKPRVTSSFIITMLIHLDWTFIVPWLSLAIHILSSFPLFGHLFSKEKKHLWNNFVSSIFWMTWQERNQRILKEELLFDCFVYAIVLLVLGVNWEAFCNSIGWDLFSPFFVISYINNEIVLDKKNVAPNSVRIL